MTTCEVCGAPEADDEGRPGCRCATRAAEREAAIESDPQLWVRPYVTGPAGLAEPAEPAGSVGDAGHAADTEPLPASPLPVMLAVEQLPEDDREPIPGANRWRRPGRIALVTVTAGAAALVLAGAAAVTNALVADEHRSSGTSADDIPGPEAVLPHSSPSPSHTGTGASHGYSAAPGHRVSLRPSWSPLPAVSHASPSPTATPTAVATASVSPSGSAGTSTTPLVLSEGDSGPEVVEMQARLKQTWAYTGAADGDFDADTRDGVARYQLWNNIQGDPKGVYGANTRRVLEAATKKP